MNKDLAYLVSNIDLQRKFKSAPDQIMIKLYPELNDIEDIMDILPSDKCVCFILLETSEESGHWTCLCRNGSCIYYFDSYGVAPDGELSDSYSCFEEVCPLFALISVNTTISRSLTLNRLL
jgi:hypothetical protein